MKKSFLELKEYLDDQVLIYNNIQFIESDPIQIPHRFQQKNDIEIAAFITATISWGNRKSIIKSAVHILDLLDNSPYDFVKNFNENDTKLWQKSIHRTFNANDLRFFCISLQKIYSEHNSLENLFLSQENETNLFPAISRFREQFLNIEHEKRTEKHVSNPKKNSASKRINMFLRWMIRKDENGVDFGLWQNIPMSKLSCPLDVHSGNIARELNLLQRKQNDRKAVEELDENLRKFDKNDPVKYDYALFGNGVNLK